MTLKEHVQFLAMMIPTLLLLAIAAMTLAFPDPDPEVSLSPESLVRGEIFIPGEDAAQDPADGGLRAAAW